MNIFKKIGLIFIASIFLLLTIALIIIDQKKDELIPTIVAQLNSKIEGEILYESASVSALKHFPDVAIIIKNPSFLSSSTDHNDTLLSFSYLDLSFDLIDLVKSEINLKQLSVYNGKIKVIQNQDSSFTFLDAISDIEAIPDSIYKENNIQLSIDRLSVKDIEFEYSQLSPQINFQSSIRSMDASLSYLNDSISTIVDLDTYIRSFNFHGSSLIAEQETRIKSEVYYNLIHKDLALQNTNAKIGEALFSLNGKIDLNDKKEINIDFEADDKDLRFTKLFFSTEANAEMIESGNLYFKGSINGTYKGALPQMTISFGSDELTLHIPKTENKIEKLNFQGNFNSGRKVDFSEARLSIKNIDAILPEGYLKGNVNIIDFQDPYLDYSINLRSRLDGLDKVFRSSSIDSISGLADVKNVFQGYLRPKGSQGKDSIEVMDIKVKNMSIKLSEDFFIKELDAVLYGEKGKVKIDSLSANFNNAKVTVKGLIDHYIGLFFSIENETVAYLEIATEQFDFPNFFDYDNNIASRFPYEINEVDMNVEIHTSFDKLREFNSTPHIEFLFHKLSAEIPSFCPPLEIYNGEFILGEKGDVFELDFNEFEMTVGTKKLNFDFYYSFSEKTNDSIVLNGNTSNLDLAESLYLDILSSFRDSSQLIIDGNFHSNLIWKTDSLTRFKSLMLESERLKFIKDTLTVSYSNALFEGSDISMLLIDGANPFSALSGNFTLDLKDLYTPILSDENIRFVIQVDSGSYAIDAYDLSRIKEHMKFNLVCRPFDTIPTYRLSYNLNGQSIEELLANHSSNSLLQGKIDLDLELSFSGINTKEILSSLDGSMDFRGDSLSIIGFDLDNIIKKFKRSQSFNLVDIGAVVVAGPVGILYSKGSDYAIMLAGNKGDSSFVSQFNSEWDIKKGRLTIEDLAFATEINRVAAKGWIDMRVDSLDLTIAVVDEYGCSIISQNLNGDLENPKKSKVKVVKTIIAPVTNLVNDILVVDCDVFYAGKVNHPANKKKKFEPNSEDEEL